MRPASRTRLRLIPAILMAVAGVSAVPAHAQQPPSVGIANPASVHCGSIGGRSEIRNGPQGQYGVCHLPDGRICEEWALFRDGRCVRPPD